MKLPNMLQKPDEGSAEQNTISNKFASTAGSIGEKAKARPLSAIRLVFWGVVWILSVAELANAVGFFKLSVNWIQTANPRPQGLAIEDSRRQAIPVLIMVGILLTTFMPFVIILPLFGLVEILSRMVVEIAWTSVLSLFLLGAAAGLAPTSSSPRLPAGLQAGYAATIGLAFGIFILLFSYTLLLLFLYAFHQGRGTADLPTSSMSEILYPFDPSIETFENVGVSPEVEKPGEQIQPQIIPTHPSQVHQPGREASSSHESQTPSSGWDDDDDDPPAGSRREKRRTRK